MYVIERNTLLQAVSKSIPGLVHFGSAPLALPVGKKIKRLRISLPGVGILHLRGIKFDLDAPELAGAKFSMSSRQEGSLPPVVLTTAGNISTTRQPLPWWQVEFPGPVFARSVAITNRRGTSSSLNYALCVEIEDEHGFTEIYDNASVGVVLLRLAAFRDVFATFAAGDWLGDEQAGRADTLRDLQDRFDRLAAALAEVLAGNAQAFAKLDGMRVELVQGIVDFCLGLPDSLCRSGIDAAATILPALLYFGTDKESPTGLDLECRAIAIVLASIFMKNKSVGLDKLTEYERFIRTSERARMADGYVAETYLKLTGDTSMMPIMIRSHGLTGATLLREAPLYVQSIKEVEKLFNDIGYELAICYGTFLGAVRERAFIPHDDDVDTVVLLKSTSMDEGKVEMARIVELLSAKGVTINLNSIGFMKIKAPVAGKRMDVFPVVALDDAHVEMFMEKLRCRPVAREKVLPFKQIEFYGETFFGPATGPEFLEDRYGGTWNVPMRQVGGGMVEAGAG